VSEISKWLKIIALSMLALTMVVIVGITSFVDPNDYAPDIEAVAGDNQLTLDIQGDISWQFFPQLGISVKRIVFSNNVISAGSIDELVVTVGLLNLLNTDFDQANLPIDSIRVVNGRARYIAPNLLPVQFDNIAVSINNFSLDGSETDFSASAQVFSDLPLSIEATVALSHDGQKLNRVNATNLQLNLDQISINGHINANVENAQIVGKLSSPSINMRRQLKSVQLKLPIFSIPVMASATALTDVHFNSEFSINSRGYSNYTHQLFIDNQKFDVTVEADQTTGLMNTSVTSDQFILHDYLPPQGSPSNNMQTGAIFAPLALPFVMWPGESQIELSVNEITMQTFSVRNLYSRLVGRANFIQLTSLNADLFGGQLNATAEFDLRDKQPSFTLKPQLNTIDLSQAFLALTGNPDVGGELSGEVAVSGIGDNLVTIQQSLLGMGQFSVINPIFSTFNVEQTVCQSAALLSGSNSSGSFAVGTQLDTLQGNLNFANGQLVISGINTAIGNLKLRGRSTVQLVEQRYTLNADALINGSKSSPTGCAINQRLQNQLIPFKCEGDFGPNSDVTPNCMPDQEVLGQLLQNTLIEKLGKKYLGVGSGKLTASGDATKDALKNFFQKKLGN
jgi:AsmA protein